MPGEAAAFLLRNSIPIHQIDDSLAISRNRLPGHSEHDTASYSYRMEHRISINPHDYHQAIRLRQSHRDDLRHCVRQVSMQGRHELVEVAVRHANETFITCGIVRHPDQHQPTIAVTQGPDSLGDVVAVTLQLEFQRQRLGQQVRLLGVQHELSYDVEVDSISGKRI